MPLLSLVIPCHNEAQNIRPLYEQLCAACKGIDFEAIFVDDGSSDDTVQTVNQLSLNDTRVSLVPLLRNYGHQTALRAGMQAAQGDFCITMDADLQHPPEAIPGMIARAQQGLDIVIMVSRDAQRGFFKNFFSWWFYRVFSLVSNVKFNHRASDFRLMSKRVVAVINQLPERQIFLRALLLNLGFAYTYEEYHLGKRFAGRPAYTFKKSLLMAVDALFSFSTFPIRILFVVGIVSAVGAFGYGLVNVYFRLFTHLQLPGFTDIVASVLFLGGMNLMMLSVLGKYLQVVLEHVKHRPEYIVDTKKLPPDAQNNS